MRRRRRSTGFEGMPSTEFDYFLATELGFRTVKQLREEMTSIEWREWYTYYRRKAQREELEALKAKARKNHHS